MRCHEEIAEVFREKDGSNVEYVGIQLLCEGKAHVAVVGVRLTEPFTSRLSKAFPNPDRQPTEMIFSQSALIFIVNKKNPISRLSPDDLRSIFMGEITDWDSLGWKAGKIHLYGTERVRNSTSMLRNDVLKLCNWPAQGVTFCGHPDAVETKVEKDVRGIGYIMAPTANELTRTKPLALLTEPEKPAVAPTRENIVTEKYPLVLRVTLLIHPDAPPAAIEYCKFACSDQVVDIAHKYGFFPVTERERVFRDRRLADYKAGKGPRVLAMGVREGEKLMQDLGMEYVKSRAVVQMSYGVSDGGVVPIARFLQGQRELLLLDGPPTGDAMLIHGDKWRKAKPEEKILAGRAVAIVVHATNKLDRLTLPQVRAIFAGEITDWRHLAAVGEHAMADTRIHRYGVRRASKTAELFHRKGMEGKSTDPIMPRMTTEKVLSSLTADPQGVGFVGAGHLPDDPAKTNLKVLAITPSMSLGDGGEAKAVLPTAENVLNGKYPIAERLFLYVSPTAKQTTKDFVVFITTPGNAVEVFRVHELLPKPIPPAPPASQPTTAPATTPASQPTSAPAPATQPA
jgi:ABC-type phosphate transport system substrate-binding protein